MQKLSRVDSVDGRGHLRAPFARMSAQGVLDHFRRRSSVRYFAVADAGQVERDKIDRLLDNRFEFNGESYRLPDDFDWLHNPSPDIEWAIMWHKFYFAVGLGMAYAETGREVYAQKWMALTSSWIDGVTVDFLSSDVTGRRVQNWIFAHYYFVGANSLAAIDAEFYDRFLMSIRQQVDYLCDNLTPSRNHRTLELYAIFLAAVVFPEFADAAEWLDFSVRELVANIESDILPDGVHCELSTDYHHIVLRNFLAIKRLALLNDIALPPRFDAGVKRALQFSLYVHKPDGSIPSLSDGDTGSFLNLLQWGYQCYGMEPLRYVATQGAEGTAPEQRAKAFPDGGYYVLRSGWGERESAFRDERYLVFDCGPLGEGNHGHLDVLSFEMAAYGRSLVVDPGRYTYDEAGDTNWRAMFRGTRYHNTVVVDGRNQTRYRFHGRKYKVKGPAPDFELRSFVSRADVDYLHGIARSHEYEVVHERKILFPKLEYWVVCDLLRAAGEHDYELLFHLTERAQDKVRAETDRHCRYVDSPHLRIVQPLSLAGGLTVEQGYVSPTYGVKHPAPIVNFSRRAADWCFCSVLYPYRDRRPEISVRPVEVLHRGRPVAPVDAVALEISIKTDGRERRDLVYFAHGSDRAYSLRGVVPTEPFWLRRLEPTGGGHAD